MDSSLALLRLLQLCNSSLPVGAYSYSEGLETLCAETVYSQANIQTAEDLEVWLRDELEHGSIRIEAAVMHRTYLAWQVQDGETLRYWRDWYAASRETEELRQQSLQMGRSLIKLLVSLEPDGDFSAVDAQLCHYPSAFGIAAAYWQTGADLALLGYLQGWVVNLVNAGVKLIPLGQTQGQQIIANLGQAVADAQAVVMRWTDDEMESNSWGLQIASMAHETLYSRIFRS
ncbi:MAG: urease accessory protein UreF [Cyanobacteria bacterium P01_F01_bin.42]